jgi:LCP family protein required for cell wall assembly
VYRRRRIGAVVVLLLLVFLILLAYLLLPIGGRVVLLGSDTRESGGTGVAEDSTGSRSDTILVAKSGKGALSVPRDTLVEIPGHGEDKINAAFAYGGPELTVDTLEDLTSLSINNYVVLDFNGVKDIVDALGGVELEVEEPISVGLDGQKVEVPAGKQNLDGLEALAYVRYRGGPTADIGRIDHQQKFLSAIIREVTSPSKVLRWPATFGAIRNNTETNMNLFEVARYVIRTGIFSGLLGKSAEVDTYPGVPQYIEGIAYWVPDVEAAAPLIEKTIE